MFEAASELHTTILLMCDCQLLVKTLLYLQLAVDRTWLLLIGTAILSTCCIKLSREIKFAWKVAKRYWNDFPLFDHQQWVLKNIGWVGAWISWQRFSVVTQKPRLKEVMYKNVATQKLQSTTMHKIQFRRYVEEISWRRIYHEEICVEFGLVAYSISYLSE